MEDDYLFQLLLGWFDWPISKSREDRKKGQASDVDEEEPPVLIYPFHHIRIKLKRIINLDQPFLTVVITVVPIPEPQTASPVARDRFSENHWEITTIAGR